MIIEKTICFFCSKNKTAICCDACKLASCKHCSYFIDKDNFEFMSMLPKKLINKTFCPDCYSKGINKEIDEFHDILRRAKAVNVYSKKQGTETRFFRRIEKPVKVENYDDRNEALLHLTFLAAQKGFDTVVDLDLKSKKVNLDGNYKKLVWSGTAVPIKVNA
ncbi:MAG: hypothetical protein A2Z20_10955 [Bdellovibrionales bacterium RBG_16_40_8]|nr:MAG: hypothetical protein A2Z20_10955 [Bdellovibrionales bacterium RBG_16_40_8]